MSSNRERASAGPAPWVFIRRWLADPRKVGSIAPSGAGLRRLIAKHVSFGADDIVVEFGGGTGAITRGLLERGVPADRLHTFEIDAEFAAYLRGRFPEVQVHHADCREADRLVPADRVGRVAAVVVTLPMLVLPMELQREVVDVIFRLLPPGGSFLMYTYSLFAPLDGRRLGLTGRRLGWTPLNIPPAAVWSYRRT